MINEDIEIRIEDSPDEFVVIVANKHYFFDKEEIDVTTLQVLLEDIGFVDVTYEEM